MLFAFVCKDKPGASERAPGYPPRPISTTSTSLNAEGKLAHGRPVPRCRRQAERQPRGRQGRDASKKPRALGEADPYAKAGLFDKRRGQGLELGLQQAGGVTDGLLALTSPNPHAWSWEQQKAAGEKGTGMDGVRNYARPQQHAADEDRRQGLLLPFQRRARTIVGIVEVCALAHPDLDRRRPDAGNASISAPCVDVPKPGRSLKRHQGRSRSSPR